MPAEGGGRGERKTPVAANYACRFAMIAFGTTVLRGAMGGSDFEGTVWAALAATAVFYGLGFVLGELARRVVEEHAAAEWERQAAERAETDAQAG